MTQPVTTNPYLDWHDRPDSLNGKISRAFQSLVSSTVSSFGFYNGSERYYLCGLDEHALATRIVKEAPISRKDFYFLDIGAGDFQWGRGMAKHLNSLAGIPEDVTFHIFSVRGERNSGEQEETHGQCKLYNLGAFPVEKMEQRFGELQLPLHKRVDLAVARYTFRHLADPVGTLQQVYELLRPESGLLAFDGFFFEQNEVHFLEYPSGQLLRLVTRMGIPFLVQPVDPKQSVRSLYHFLLKRPDDHPPKIPLQYRDCKGVNGYGLQLASNTITQFTTTTTPVNHRKGNRIRVGDDALIGDRALYEEVKQAGALCINGHYPWKPLYEDQQSREVPYLHQLVKAGDISAVEAHLLEDVVEINRSDDQGNTALNLAAQGGQLELCALLLDRGANSLLHNDDALLPIHHLIHLNAVDLVAQLLDEGQTKVNLGDKDYKTLTDHAIEANAESCTALLRDRGGKTRAEKLEEHF